MEMLLAYGTRALEYTPVNTKLEQSEAVQTSK